MKNFSIGIDLGGTKILIALVKKASGEVVHFIKKKTKKEKGSENIVRKIICGINELFEETKTSKNNILSIGVAAAGQVDRENGIILRSPNLNCCDLNLRLILESEFNLPVYLANDVEAAALSEMKFGAGKGVDDLVCVFIGTGVGSCIVKDGKIIRGATGTAGEIGHMIVDLNGRQCNCGAHGCLEAYASRSAIEKRIEGALKKGCRSIITEYPDEERSITSGMIKKAVECNDELVTYYVDEAAAYLSCGLASVINLINPKLIILGGGLIEAVDYFYQKTIKYTKLKCLPVPAAKIEFKKNSLGDFSGVIGAAYLK